MALSLQDLENGDYSSAVAPVSSAAASAQSQATATVSSLQAQATSSAMQLAASSGVSGYVFQAQNIVGTAQSYGQTANTVINGIGALTGSSGVDLTGDQAKAQTQKVAEAIMAIPVIGTAIGGALLAITSAAGYAHAGAGVCATNPPASIAIGDLQNWQYYTPWQNSVANLAPDGEAWVAGNDASGSFEDFANRALAYNRALLDNCFGSYEIKPPVLLAQLIASWNYTHEGPTRLITRRMPSGNLGQSPIPGYDPISDALSYTAQFPPTAGTDVSFAVNDGKPIFAIKLAPPSVAASVAKTVGVGVAIAAGVGAAGLGVYALATHQSFVGAATALWHATAGRVVSYVNPLPEVARETFARASGGSTTVQTLLFPRPRFGSSRAKAWARAHGYVAPKTDLTANYVRIRQKPPGDFKKGSLRTINLGRSGVRAVVGHLR
jgi:hypothetical protein